MRAMGGRPVLMERYPHGAEGSSFFQKRVPDNAPDWLTTTIVSTPNGTTSRALVIADLAHVAWAVNLGCLGFHVWPARADDPEHADELRIDLDPTPGTDFEDARARRASRARAARRARHRRLPEDHRASTASTCTCGSRRVGIRIQVRRGAVAFARELARRHPDVVTDAWWKEERGAAHLHRLQPERAAQDGVRRVVRAAAAGRAGVDAVRLGRARHDRSRRADDRDRARARRRARRSVGRHGHRRRSRSNRCSRCYERDLANGLTDAPWPPVYPKMPGEPPRVAPSRARKATKATD